MTSSAVLNGYTLGTDDNMPLICMALQAADEVSLDTETTGLNVRNGVDYMISLCFATDKLKGYIPFRHTQDNVSRRWIEPLFDILKKKPLNWHNLKFDYHSIKTLGVDPMMFEGPQFDCLLGATLNNEEEYSKELDFLCKKYIKRSKIDSDEVHAFGQIHGYAKLPPHLFGPYGAEDADLTRELKSFLIKKLERQNLLSVYWDTEAPFARLLYLMEQEGVAVHTDFAERKSYVGRARMGAIQRELGWDPASRNDLSNYLIEELKLPVLERSPKTGNPSFNKRVMEEYDLILQERKDKTAQLVSEFRGWQKAVTSLYEPLVNKLGPDGRIRTNFRQDRTVTGRLSSQDPNLQQIPRSSNKPWNGNAKSAFHSGYDDFSLVGWDYSQIEFRLAAAYGDERELLEEFEKPDADPFKVLTPKIFNGQYNEELRHKTKNGFVYPSLYGAQLAKVAATLGISPAEARPLYENYKKSIPGIMEVSEQVRNLMYQRKYITYWDGRRRRIRNRDEVFTRAWNSLLQGGAAQLMKQAMLRCQEFCDDDCRMVLSVHDEITFIIREEAIPDYEPKIVEAMTDWPKFGVKFAAEKKVWSHATK